MADQHPITPPLELVRQWRKASSTGELHFSPQYLEKQLYDIATQAARWGADQELEACCSEVQWLESTSTAIKIRDARRPKPPSLKEQALEALKVEDDAMPLRSLERGERFDLIRRALEALDD
jgi:hypothetical protein